MVRINKHTSISSMPSFVYQCKKALRLAVRQNTNMNESMKWRHALEHSRELFTDTFKQFLDGSGIANEGNRHPEAAWWNVALKRINNE